MDESAWEKIDELVDRGQSKTIKDLFAEDPVIQCPPDHPRHPFAGISASPQPARIHHDQLLVFRIVLIQKHTFAADHLLGACQILSQP